jgi:hypothetical protein
MLSEICPAKLHFPYQGGHIPLRREMTFGNGIKTAVEAFFQAEGKMNVDRYLCVIGQSFSNHNILTRTSRNQNISRLAPHPHPNPPLEGEGVKMPQRKISAKFGSIIQMLLFSKLHYSGDREDTCFFNYILLTASGLPDIYSGPSKKIVLTSVSLRNIFSSNFLKTLEVTPWESSP